MNPAILDISSLKYGTVTMNPYKTDTASIVTDTPVSPLSVNVDYRTPQERMMGIVKGSSSSTSSGDSIMKELRLFSHIEKLLGIEVVVNTSQTIRTGEDVFLKVLIITVENKKSKGGPSKYVAGIKPHMVAPISKHLVPWLESRGETKAVHPCYENFFKVTLRKTPYNKENLPMTSASKKKRDDGQLFTVDALATLVYGKDMAQLNSNVNKASQTLLPFFKHPTFRSEVQSCARSTSTNPKYLKMVTEALKDLQKATLRVVPDSYLDAIITDESITDIGKVICDYPDLDIQQLKDTSPALFAVLFKDADYDPVVKEEI